jgi:hypothetical protein
MHPHVPAPTTADLVYYDGYECVMTDMINDGGQELNKKALVLSATLPKLIEKDAFQSKICGPVEVEHSQVYP